MTAAETDCVKCREPIATHYYRRMAQRTGNMVVPQHSASSPSPAPAARTRTCAPPLAPRRVPSVASLVRGSHVRTAWRMARVPLLVPGRLGGPAMRGRRRRVASRVGAWARARTRARRRVPMGRRVLRSAGDSLAARLLRRRRAAGAAARRRAATTRGPVRRMAGGGAVATWSVTGGTRIPWVPWAGSRGVPRWRRVPAPAGIRSRVVVWRTRIVGVFAARRRGVRRPGPGARRVGAVPRGTGGLPSMLRVGRAAWRGGVATRRWWAAPRRRGVRVAAAGALRRRSPSATARRRRVAAGVAAARRRVVPAGAGARGRPLRVRVAATVRIAARGRASSRRWIVAAAAARRHIAAAMWWTTGPHGRAWIAMWQRRWAAIAATRISVRSAASVLPRRWTTAIAVAIDRPVNRPASSAL